MVNPTFCCVTRCPSFEMDNTNDTLMPGPSDRMQNLEAEVEGLTHLLGAVANQMVSPKAIDPAIPAPLAQPVIPKLN